ncbi:MAG: tetratricopeptide repeat protein [Firmicutes bacterium]|nr:tetratricopeptide repeat protein [Bacillota bacterium]
MRNILKIFCFFIIIFAFFLAPARSEKITRNAVGEAPAPYKGKGKVALEKFFIKINFSPERSRVEAVYTFKNKGKKKLVLMGFPDIEATLRKTNDYNFTGPLEFFNCRVDGKTVKVYNWKKEGGRGGKFPLWKVWRVDFKKEQRRTIQTVFWVKNGSDSFGHRILTYELINASGWAGKISKGEILVVFTNMVPTQLRTLDNYYFDAPCEIITTAGFSFEKTNIIKWGYKNFSPGQDSPSSVKIATVGSQLLPFMEGRAFVRSGNYQKAVNQFQYYFSAPTLPELPYPNFYTQTMVQEYCRASEKAGINPIDFFETQASKEEQLTNVMPSASAGTPKPPPENSQTASIPLSYSLYHLAIAKNIRGDSIGALKAYEKIKEPGEIIFDDYIKLLMGEKKWTAAENKALEETKKFPEYWNGYCNLAYIQLYSGKKDEALKSFTEAVNKGKAFLSEYSPLKYYPTPPPAQVRKGLAAASLNMAEIYKDAGMKEEAKKMEENAKLLDPAIKIPK